MKELSELVEKWKQLPQGESAILATVVATGGSTYRRPGVRMLLTSKGWAAGSISGGCLEGDVIQSAWERTQNGPALVTYDSTSESDIVWGFGLGCNGIVQVLMERLPPNGGILDRFAEHLNLGQPIRIYTVISPGELLGTHRFFGQDAASDEFFAATENGTVSRNDQVYLVETILPPRSLLIFGGGHDALPVVRAAKLLGWHVTIIDGREAYATADRFPLADRIVFASPADAVGQLTVDDRAAAVVMNHHFLNDLEVVGRLLQSSVGYIGMLGPRRRAERVLEELTKQGKIAADSDLRRLHAPIGLDIGAEGPDEIALSVVSEIQAFFAGRPGGHLNGRVEPLHPETSTIVATPETQNLACAR